MRVFQIREHHAQIVKLGRYDPYSEEFISHVASKHTVWHLYFCDITIICLEQSWFCEKIKIENFSCFSHWWTKGREVAASFVGLVGAEIPENTRIKSNKAVD